MNLFNDHMKLYHTYINTVSLLFYITLSTDFYITLSTDFYITLSTDFWQNCKYGYRILYNVLTHFKSGWSLTGLSDKNSILVLWAASCEGPGLWDLGIVEIDLRLLH